MSGSPASSSTGSQLYRGAGVDIDKAERSLSAIREMARSTLSVEHQIGEIGHFGGVFPIPSGADRLLVASADGIGTKLKLAFVLGGRAHRQVGADLVNHCVNDILACGAKPLFFLDYVAMGRLDPAVLESLVEGMASACRENFVALIGGETAEMPGLYGVGEYDVAGFIVGEVAPHRYVDGSSVRAGDLLIGFPAMGLHTNGYSLARRLIGLTGELEHDRQVLDRTLEEGPRQTLATALMAPHPSYLRDVQPLLEAGIVQGMAHITGGGLLGNVPRMIPRGLCAGIDPSTWSSLPIFSHLVDRGRIAAQERFRVFNMGIGFVTAVRPQDVEHALGLAPKAFVIGEVVRSPDLDSRRAMILGVE